MTFHATYIGGPTTLIEIGGARLLTDPTFDAAGSAYETPVYTLHKTHGPALPAGSLGEIDAVLLSHDHHFDNLDRSGRTLLGHAKTVLTTAVGAERLGPPAVGLRHWQTERVHSSEGRTLNITGTPARHGPADGDRGPVTGFVIALDGQPDSAVYVSGDTVWYDGVQEVARRFPVKVAFLFVGAARVHEVGPAHLTFTADEAVEAARAFGDALIVPVHFEGWAHFSEGRDEIARAFANAGMSDRLRWLHPGARTELPLGNAVVGLR